MTERERGITSISVSGFKSLRDESRIEIRPLTILAGANSSGKSSIMQPLLLMKQTLEAPYDAGTFKLDGPNVQFTDVNQFFSWFDENSLSTEFIVAITLDGQHMLRTVYGKGSGTAPVTIVESTYKTPHSEITINPDSTHEEIIAQFPRTDNPDTYRFFLRRNDDLKPVEWKVVSRDCFLEPGFMFPDGASTFDLNAALEFFPSRTYARQVIRMIHLPGFRGNPKRTYPITAVSGSHFDGTFENYTASVIRRWIDITSDERNLTEFRKLTYYLRMLNLTSALSVLSQGDTQIEIRVNRTLQAGPFVSIADVGFGVSQVLPVLVALLVAEPGQLVYLEQPELHLHPRAQVLLAEVLADAANRGVRVVAETHSSLLLLGVQTLIAEGKLAPDKVMLHWFKRNDEGKTEINSVEPDANGAYGDWPEDFDDVELNAQKRYLDAVATREMEL